MEINASLWSNTWTQTHKNEVHFFCISKCILNPEKLINMKPITMNENKLKRATLTNDKINFQPYLSFLVHV